MFKYFIITVVVVVVGFAGSSIKQSESCYLRNMQGNRNWIENRFQIPCVTEASVYT